MQTITDTVLDSSLDAAEFFNADPVIWESDFTDEPLFEGATNSKYVEFAGSMFELRSFNNSTIFYFDYHYIMPDELPLYLAIALDADSGEYSLTCLNSHNFISVLGKSCSAPYQLDRGERIPINEGDIIYIGTERFLVSTQRSIQDPSLKALKLIQLD